MGELRCAVEEPARHEASATRHAAPLGRPGGGRGPVAPHVAGGLSLQRLAGNAAVGALLGGTAARPASPPVQRCGPLHPDCGCAEEPATALALAPLTVSRQPDSPAGGFQDGTPDNPTPELPPGSQYAGLDPELRATLGRTLTAKVYGPWVAAKPTNLGDALDHMGVENINTLLQLKNRMFPKGLWTRVETIKNVWTTSSLGIDYNGPSMQAELDAEGSGFCKDTTIGEAYHSGECWREIVDANAPGLHFCTPDSIHIDPHQTSTGTQGGIQFGGGSFIRLRDNYCSYSMIAFVSHMMDVEGGRSVNIFHRYAKIRERIGAAKTKAQRLQATAPEAGGHVSTLDSLEQRRLALDPILRGWAVQGFQGGDAGDQVRDVDTRMDGIEADLDRVEQALTDIETQHAEPDGVPVLME
jgi:hypothetical protein